MQKILVHSNGNRQYRSLIRHLSLLQSESISVQISNLHNNIFDTTYVFKPDILLYPFIEYTQEIHNYVENYHNKHKIILYIDLIIENPNLVSYLSQTNCSFVVKNNTTQFNSKALTFDYLYDDTIYYMIPDIIKNNKVAVSLSNDNTKNKTILESYIYPNECEYPIVLFNNPEFKHPQNIGIYNEQDLNYVLNTYSYFVDIDREFELETAATNTLWLDGNHDFIEQIKHNQISNQFTKTHEKYRISNFMKEQLIPYLGL
jgi:hypothetical protein